MIRLLNGIAKVVASFLMIAVIILLFNYPFMLAVNYVFSKALLKAVFGVEQLSFWRVFLFVTIVSVLSKRVS